MSAGAHHTLGREQAPQCVCVCVCVLPAVDASHLCVGELCVCGKPETQLPPHPGLLRQSIEQCMLVSQPLGCAAVAALRLVIVTPPGDTSRHVVCGCACGIDREGVAACAACAGTQHETVSCFCLVQLLIRVHRASARTFSQAERLVHKAKSPRPACSLCAVTSLACTTLVLRPPRRLLDPGQCIAGPGLPPAEWPCPPFSVGTLLHGSVLLATAGWLSACWLILPAVNTMPASLSSNGYGSPAQWIAWSGVGDFSCGQSLVSPQLHRSPV